MYQKWIRYYKVGKLLHFVALFAFLITIYALSWMLLHERQDNPFIFNLWMATFLIFGGMAILAELDGFSRYQNYKQVKDQLYLNGYQERLLKPLLRSSCQREAAILAGTELGLEPEVKAYYYNRGYRWYHIIPDFVFQYPWFFFSLYFWRTTFFTPYYRSKVNYDLIDLSQEDLKLKGIQIGTP